MYQVLHVSSHRVWCKEEDLLVASMEVFSLEHDLRLLGYHQDSHQVWVLVVWLLHLVQLELEEVLLHRFGQPA